MPRQQVGRGGPRTWTPKRRKSWCVSFLALWCRDRCVCTTAKYECGEAARGGGSDRRSPTVRALVAHVWCGMCAHLAILLPSPDLTRGRLSQECGQLQHKLDRQKVMNDVQTYLGISVVRNCSGACSSSGERRCHAQATAQGESGIESRFGPVGTCQNFIRVRCNARTDRCAGAGGESGE